MEIVSAAAAISFPPASIACSVPRRSARRFAFSSGSSPRRTRPRPSRRHPSSSSRAARCAPPVRGRAWRSAPLTGSPGASARPPHPPPARRYCRCSSARPRAGPPPAACAQKCRPGWRCADGPTCAALFGLMLVCSTSECTPAPKAGVLLRLRNRRQRRAAVEPRIQVSRTGNFETRKAGKRLAVQRLQQLCCDLLGRSAQRTRQLKGHRRRVVAHGHLRRLFYIDSARGAIHLAGHGGSRLAVAFEQDAAQPLAQNLLHVSVQWRVLAAAARSQQRPGGPQKP